MNTDALKDPVTPDSRLQFWLDSPQLARVSPAARALWLLLVMQPAAQQLQALSARIGLPTLETSKLIAELMVEKLVEVHGHIVLDPAFSAVPRAGMASIPATTQATAPGSASLH